MNHNTHNVGSAIKDMEYIARHVAHEANNAIREHCPDQSRQEFNPDAIIPKIAWKALHDGIATSPHNFHTAWKENKLKEGWTYGPVQDNENKKHPNLKDYDKLAPLERYKDYVYRAIWMVTRDFIIDEKRRRERLAEQQRIDKAWDDCGIEIE